MMMEITSGLRCSSFCLTLLVRTMLACKRLHSIYSGELKKHFFCKSRCVVKIQVDFFLFILPFLFSKELPRNFWQPATTLSRCYQTNACSVHAGPGKPTGTITSPCSSGYFLFVALYSKLAKKRLCRLPLWRPGPQPLLSCPMKATQRCSSSSLTCCQEFSR